MSSITYKRATMADYPLLFEMEKRTFIRDFDITFATVEEFKKFFLDKPYELSIVCKNDQPVGSLFLLITPDSVELEGLTIVPDYQHQGIGTEVMHYTLSRFPGKLFHLVTHPKNFAAIKLYYNNDFIIVGYKENYYGDGQPRLLLSRVPH